MNIVTSPQGVPHAVLVRALEPVAGISDKTWGPGLLCRAMRIDRSLTGEDLLGKRLWLEQPRGSSARARIGTSPRIGVDYAGRWAKCPWRFFDRESPYVSTASARMRRERNAPGASAPPGT